MRFIHTSIFLFAIFAISAFACSGDCVSCHRELDYKDSRHSAMTTCKTCHTAESLAKVNMSVNSCGTDCFACHTASKIDDSIKEHQSIKSCIQCHQKIDDSKNQKSIFDLDKALQNKELNKIFNMDKALQK